MTDFFDKVKQGINKGVVTVGAKSREALDSTILTSQIDTLRRQKETALQDLGVTVYALFTRNVSDEDKVRNRCQAVARIDLQIAYKEDELKKVHIKTDEILGRPIPLFVCDCGNDIYEATKFCGRCGKKVDVPQQAYGEDMTCPQCNSIVSSGVKFCTVCGRSTKDTEQHSDSRSREKVCRQCATRNSPGASFCKKCGAGLE